MVGISYTRSHAIAYNKAITTTVVYTFACLHPGIKHTSPTLDPISKPPYCLAQNQSSDRTAPLTT